jgi:hypothetical protein
MKSIIAGLATSQPITAVHYQIQGDKPWRTCVMYAAK